MQQRSDARGRVDLGSLSGGRWRLVTNWSGYRAAQVVVEVQGQPFEEVEFWLERR